MKFCSQITCVRRRRRDRFSFMLNEEQRRLVGSTPESLGQWLRDVYATGLQSNGILLVSGSMFATFMDAYDRVILHKDSQHDELGSHSNLQLDNAARHITDLSQQRLLGNDGSNVDNQSSENISNTVDDGWGVYDDDSSNDLIGQNGSQVDDHSEDQSDVNHVNQTISDAFGLDQDSDTVGVNNDGQISQPDAGWQTGANSQDDDDANQNQNDDVIGNFSDDDSDDDEDYSKGQPIYDESESDVASQHVHGYSDMDPHDQVSTVPNSGTLAGNTADSIMTNGMKHITSSLESEEQENTVNVSRSHDVQPSADQSLSNDDVNNGYDAMDQFTSLMGNMTDNDGQDNSQDNQDEDPDEAAEESQKNQIAGDMLNIPVSQTNVHTEERTDGSTVTTSNLFGDTESNVEVPENDGEGQWVSPDNAAKSDQVNTDDTSGVDVPGPETVEASDSSNDSDSDNESENVDTTGNNGQPF